MVLRLRGRGRVGRRQPSLAKPASAVREAGFMLCTYTTDVQTRFGTIALAGRPNAGKSTLLNALVGEPLAITSAKPQSTRVPVVGIRAKGSVQIVFIDP